MVSITNPLRHNKRTDPKVCKGLLKYSKLVANFAFNFKLRRYNAEHIPPVVSADVVSFPYEITLPGETESTFGQGLMDSG